ncbi:cupin domain-containing protein [Ramlibacter sp.]|uniref:cupin domain-containing protein n=1 Tax=Ramlibacter sp. TaxID=1917967 RepID=UPI003D1299F1
MDHSSPPRLPLHQRIVRYAELVPQRNSFIDKRTPGSAEEETFSVIGPGVIENQTDRHIHIREPHGFNMGGARMPPGCVNSQHSHETAEVFLCHRGAFTMILGPDGQDGEFDVNVGDVVSFPTRIFRGFRSIGVELGHLVSVLGENNPGRVTWAPYVFEAARGHGLLLLEDGTLVDTVAGESVPEGAKLVTPTTEDDVKAYRRVTAADMGSWVVRIADLAAAPGSPLAGPGVEECPVIGVANPAENMPAAPIPHPHNFQMRRVRMQPGAGIRRHTRKEVEVLFVHGGSVDIEAGGETFTLNKGDYFSLPVGEYRSWANRSGAPNDVQVVRGGNHPAAPVF